ncbi:hypothetical protein P2318_03515 [Myxococcaceae bacterium GXIMD 01537]
MGLDFGGAHGYVNDGTLSPNPATGAASCPDGYTQTAVFGSSGRDWPVYFCHRPAQEGAEPLLDFGGMWGVVNGSPVKNPVTNASSCPAGYTTQQLLGTYNLDHNLYICHKPHVPGIPPTNRFGGAFGYVNNGVLAPNPATGEASCPAGHVQTQVLGTSGVDWSLSFCMSRAPSLEFGGAFGYIDGSTLSPNPATGAASCPEGYTQTQLLGTDSFDAPVFICSRPHWEGSEAFYDFGGMWGFVDSKVVNNPYTNKAGCPDGYTAQRVFGTSGQDYDLHLCYKPHDTGTAPEFPFGGMWGHANGAEAVNPATGVPSCPSGFLPRRMQGTSNVDHSLYLCESPATSLDFGGAIGYVNGGTLSPNPATGAASCPDGYTATRVFGTWGKDHPVLFCQRPSRAGAEPLYDFGGMWGTVNSSPVKNPVTNASSCPAGYTAQQLLGTYNLDHNLYVCFKPHVPGVPPTNRFGGMHGHIEGVVAPNPATGAASCPAGHVQTQVLGTHNVDWALSFCMSRAPSLEFGGAFGYVNNGTLSPNPATGTASCPEGYTQTQLLGTDSFDAPVFICSRPHWEESEPLYDFGGMWGTVDATVVNNPFTNKASCPAGYTAQKVFGTLNRDYDLHLCHKPHVAGTEPEFLFGGMWGQVNGVVAPNPATGVPSCPSGFISRRMLGTQNVDHSLYVCETPAANLDFGGAIGYVNGGTLSPNPATGTASCPNGYTQTRVYGTWGKDHQVLFCQRPSVEGVEPLYDFGGMWGVVGNSQMNNPLTNKASCPAGYTAQQLLGTHKLDHSLYVCYKPHVAGTPPEHRFGGMHGYIEGVAVPNPATGAASCPAGHEQTQVMGTHNVDWPLSYCMARATRWDFGGAFGYVDAGVLSPNPATGAASCPAGYVETKVLGTHNLDWPASICSRPHQDGNESLYDFGGMWGSINGSPVRNPFTNEARCPAGYTAQRILGTSGTDYDLYLCHKPHVAGTESDYPFAGMWGHVDGVAVPNPATGAVSCPRGFAPTQVLGTSGTDSPLYFCEPVHTKFAPRLRFDGSARGYPMSAQVFYDNAVVTPQQTRIENRDASTLGTGTLPTYYQVTECGQQVRIKYWWFYGYQSACDPFGNGTHNGDWEDVTVTLSEDSSSIAAITFTMHGKTYTRLAVRGGFRVEDGTHPVVYVGKNSHAAHYQQGGSGVDDNCLPWEEYRNNSTGTHLNSWVNLVNLDTGKEPWMVADRVGGFLWGHDGVSTHPTQRGPSCRMNAASWTFDTPTWWHSQCKAGDRDDGTTCHSTCRSGYTDMGLTCTNWSWSSLHTYSQNIYRYDYTLPTTDRGLMVSDPR